ncbi:TetR/AcrR family transcriptional regulator [Pontibacter populi]|uniref:TetR/AcrR family transcriptional regulator n=2 Tax=Pontibacter populi TaxID=890055 RepID=A0ABV1RTZ9_9BACT
MKVSIPLCVLKLNIMPNNQINLNLNHRSYLREPEATELGRRILSESIKLIDELGFEQFTFKKLATEIGTTEASVYRYFENKHKLLVYLVSWYWAWLNYTINYHTHNISDPRERLSRAIEVITTSDLNDPTTSHIDERTLFRIVVAESPKVYHTKDVDAENQEGYFLELKKLCRNVAETVAAINPAYPYPHALISTLLDSAHQQLFFAEHLPSLTEVKGGPQSRDGITAFLKNLAFATIDNR